MRISDWSSDVCSSDLNALRLNGLTVIAPDGKAIAASNENTGKYRNTFDVELKPAGPYRLALVNNGMSASYKVDGKNKRWRGTRTEERSGGTEWVSSCRSRWWQSH